MTRPTDEQFRALFDPKGVVVAGASSHPGKFGFVSLHNILAGGYEGRVFATNLQGEEVLGIRTVASARRPARRRSRPRLRVHAGPGQPGAAEGVRGQGHPGRVRHVGRLRRGGRGRAAGPSSELVELCDDLGILLAGPNGQGLVSTPSKLCAQIVGPNPPPGRIGVASQSGNFVSSFLNWAAQSGVGISRAVSAGNAAAVTVADYLDFYADDPATAVGLAYVEGIADGRAFFERVRAIARRQPLVLVKGGATEGGQRAAASHTGALAANDRIFDGAMRQAGVVRAANVEEAFEAAATFATQPLPKGPNVAVVTTAGGWGVVTADAITRHRDLVLLPLPDDLRAAIDASSRPAGAATTRSTWPAPRPATRSRTCSSWWPRHPDVHAVIFLGLGIQSNEAKLMRNGRFYPDHGLERIVEFHERQDARYAETAAAVSDGDRQADPDGHRAGRGRSRQPGSGGGPRARGGSATPRPTGPSPRSATSRATPGSSTPR